MATTDNKTFGKFEIEWAYDWCAMHRGANWNDIYDAVEARFPEATKDEIVIYVNTARKARRQEIMAKQRDDIRTWSKTFVKAGHNMAPAQVILAIDEAWDIGRQAASNLLDSVARELMSEAAKAGDTTTSLRYAKFVVVTEEELKVQGENYAKGFVKDRDESSVVMLHPGTSQALMKADHARKAFFDAYRGLQEWSETLFGVKHVPAQDARTRPEHHKPPNPVTIDFSDDNAKMIMDIINEGEKARDSGAASPYRGNTLAHMLHATGWVLRDLSLALERETNGRYIARKINSAAIAMPEAREVEGAPEALFNVGDLVDKKKGYRFPGEVLTVFHTRKDKLRFVVEGIGADNDEILHIWGEGDLVEIAAPHGWVFRDAGGNWGWHIDRRDDVECRPATEAEASFVASIVSGYQKPPGNRT